MDTARTPVIAATGQAIERDEPVAAIDLATRAAESALASSPALRGRIQRISVVDIVFSPAGGRPASDLARRLGLDDVRAEVSFAGGNTPQWLVTRAAAAIAAGELDTTLIAGAEALRSLRATDPGREFMGGSRRPTPEGPQDERVGPSIRDSVGKAEVAAGLFRPAHVYPLFENALAHREGRSFEQQRRHLAPVMSSFSRVAAGHPYAWFRKERSASEISTVSADNRLIAEPYPKLMNAFPNVDQGAAVIVTSLATACELGIEDGCLFIWSGANASEPPLTARPELWTSPAMNAAAAGALEAAGVGPDNLAAIDLYSCFPIAVEAGASALGVELDDPRGLTVTGGLPFFGGPGNNYSLHAIATLPGRLRGSEGLGYIGANGGMLSKQSTGIYGSTPPPRGFRLADTTSEQARIDADVLPVASAPDSVEGFAKVVTSTVIYRRDGSIEDVPVIAVLEDGRRVAARAAPSLHGSLQAVELIGSRIRLSGDPPTYVPA